MFLENRLGFESISGFNFLRVAKEKKKSNTCSAVVSPQLQTR